LQTIGRKYITSGRKGVKEGVGGWLVANTNQWEKLISGWLVVNANQWENT
jgi:hypothetical protein